MALNAAFRTVVKGTGRQARAFPIKSAAYRIYEKEVEALLGPRRAQVDDRSPLAVTARLFRPRRAGDIDSPLKVLFDVCNGRLWSDDVQLVELHVFRGDDKVRPRIELDIEELEVAEVSQ